MTVRLEVEVSCDVTGCTTPPVTAEQGEAAGWLLGAGADLCPAHRPEGS